MGKVKVLDYVLISTMLVLSTFEYFFRAEALSPVFLICCLAIALYKGLRLEILPSILIFSIFVILLIQAVIDEGSTFLRPIYLILALLGVYSLAWLTKASFIRAFTNIILFIAGTSMIIYFLSLIPSVNNYLFNIIAPKFPSLNVESAIFEGGGKNIIIYNFYANYVSDAIGFRRNCGPFWEPGMFAVFLNLALFFNLIILKGSNKANLLLIISLVSTFSAGGYFSLLFILAGYFLLKKKSPYSIFAIFILIFAIYFAMNMEFIGVKILNQMDNHEIGNDTSRFGAFYTHIQMIQDNLIIGGGKISDYVHDSKTLASGLLLPLVNYGMLVGSFMYYCYYKSCKNITSSVLNVNYAGLFLFIVFLVLSFSQTVLTSTAFMTILFYGLISKKNETI